MRLDKKSSKQANDWEKDPEFKLGMTEKEIDEALDKMIYLVVLGDMIDFYQHTMCSSMPDGRSLAFQITADVMQATCGNIYQKYGALQSLHSVLGWTRDGKDA